MYLDAPVYIWGVQCIYTAYLTGGAPHLARIADAGLAIQQDVETLEIPVEYAHVVQLQRGEEGHHPL